MRALQSLHLRMLLAMLAPALLGLLVHSALTRWPLPQWLLALPKVQPGVAAAVLQAPGPGNALALGITAGVMLLGWALAARWALAPLPRLLRALEGAVLSFRDGDYSHCIATQPAGELSPLLRLHAELGQALREQRQQLVQRELMLDTVVQNSPVALVLTRVLADGSERVAIANIAARQLLHGGRGLVGEDFAKLRADLPEAMHAALAADQDTLFSTPLEGGDETFHLSQHAFSLQGRSHRLRLLRRMTRELSRQEVATWKRVIRVLSHELNNSLAPISSLAHSGAELVRRGDLARVPGVFDVIAERASHLHAFLGSYARFAKLPQPQPQPVDWPAFLAALAVQCRFELATPAPAQPGWFDPAQLEQVLINLVANAHESGGPAHEVALAVSLVQDGSRALQCVQVLDRGSGMTETVLAQALLPFYSTKRAGTGIGLALAREIVEAHGGNIALANRRGGGLRVTLTLPCAVPSPL